MNRLGEIIIVAGPNGGGKTSFAKAFLPAQLRDYTFVNADEIAKRLDRKGLSQTQVDFRAGREMLNRISNAVTLGDDLMIETTLASANWARHIPEWQSRGYLVELYYLRLPTVEAAIARVAGRVATGGHDIPVSVIRRRFQRSLQMLEQRYRPVVDRWYIFDSIEDGPPALAESGARDG